jgi:hypothetical protein
VVLYYYTIGALLPKTSFVLECSPSAAGSTLCTIIFLGYSCGTVRIFLSSYPDLLKTAQVMHTQWYHFVRHLHGYPI